MTMTVSHAHVTHGTSGRKGEKMSSVTDFIFVVLDALVKICKDDLITTSNMTPRTKIIFLVRLILVSLAFVLPADLPR